MDKQTISQLGKLSAGTGDGMSTAVIKGFQEDIKDSISCLSEPR